MLDQKDRYSPIASSLGISHTTPVVKRPHLGNNCEHLCADSETYLIPYPSVLPDHLTNHISGVSSLFPQMLGERVSGEVDYCYEPSNFKYINSQ